jgi:hypothetical protein
VGLLQLFSARAHASRACNRNTVMMNTTLDQISANLDVGALRVVWESCFRKEVCVRIPFDGKKCISASGCLRILLENGVYKLEISLFGVRKSFPLVDQCITGFTVGVASVQVCVSGVKLDGGRLRSVRLTARLCIGTKIGPIDIKKCWDVISAEIKLFAFENYAAMRAEDKLTAFTEAFQIAQLSGSDYIYLDLHEATEASGRCECDD